MVHYKIVPSMILMLFISAVTTSVLFVVNRQLTPLVVMVGDLSTSRRVAAESTASRPMPTATMSELTLDMVVSLAPTVAPLLPAAQVLSTPSTLTSTQASTAILSTASIRSGIVNSDLVNVRNYPSLAGAVIGQTRQGERLEILAMSHDGLWLRVCCPSGNSEESSQSWIATEFVAINPDLP